MGAPFPRRWCAGCSTRCSIDNQPTTRTMGPKKDLFHGVGAQDVVLDAVGVVLHAEAEQFHDEAE